MGKGLSLRVSTGKGRVHSSRSMEDLSLPYLGGKAVYLPKAMAMIGERTTESKDGGRENTTVHQNRGKGGNTLWEDLGEKEG